jgi:hypothetical protein
MNCSRPWGTAAWSLITTFVAATLIISCRPQPVDEKPTPVSCSTLIRDYRDLSPDRSALNWTGRRIQVSLPSEGYEVDDSRILVFGGLPKAPPSIVFECAVSLTNNRNAVEVIGVCKGVSYDGRNRGMGVLFCVFISSCSVMVR